MNKQHGFNLVEVLIICSMIAILSAIGLTCAISQYNKTVDTWTVRTDYTTKISYVDQDNNSVTILVIPAYYSINNGTLYIKDYIQGEDRHHKDLILSSGTRWIIEDLTLSEVK